MHFDSYRQHCHKNKGIVVIILIELFVNNHLDGAQPSDIEQKILLSPLGDNCLVAIKPITAFPYYCYKRL